jgi:hypothetical protein
LNFFCENNKRRRLERAKAREIYSRGRKNSHSPKMSSDSRRFIGLGSACDESEPLNKSAAGMRGRAIARPKLRSILVVMLIGVSAVAVIGTISLVVAGFSKEIETAAYNGE